MAKDMKNKNQLNRKKLLKSNWTAVAPKNKEKHFTVSKVEISENDPQVILSVIVTAVLTSNSYKINYKDLNDGSIWTQGWN
jgi:tryptophan-rich hypothetical protein